MYADALVTGATGLIGTHVVRQLTAAGKQVRCVVRASSDTTDIRAAGVETVTADLSHAPSLRAAIENARTVIHLAGHLHVASPLSDHEEDDTYRLNVDATRQLLEVSAAGGVQRFVYASSVAVYSPEAVSPIAEDGPRIPASAYGRSKMAAEDLVTAFHGNGLETTVIRPSIVYGAEDRHFLPAVRELSKLAILPLMAGGRHLIDLTAATDVAAVIVAATYAPAAAGRVYNAASGHPTAVRDLLAIMHEVEGSPIPRVLPMPVFVMRLLAPLVRGMLAAARPGIEGIVGPLAARYGTRDVFYDVRRAATELGVTPRLNFRNGMLET